MGRDQIQVARLEREIPSRLMLEQVRWGLQLPPPNLNLPNGVDDLERCVIIAYKQLGRIL